MENKNVNTTGMQEADAAEEQEMEMQQAQAGGTVDFITHPGLAVLHT